MFRLTVVFLGGREHQYSREDNGGGGKQEVEKKEERGGQMGRVAQGPRQRPTIGKSIWEKTNKSTWSAHDLPQP